MRQLKIIKYPPFDLLLVPLVVLSLFYLVVLQLESDSKQNDMSIERRPNNNQISLDTVEIHAPQNPKMMMKARRVPRANRSRSYSPISSVGSAISYSNSREETLQSIKENKIQSVADNSISTFSVDVDTGGYTNIRRLMNMGQLPKRNQIRTEEIINYFNYNYPAPLSREQAFIITTGLTQSPWNENSHIMQIGMKGYVQVVDRLPNSNIVFLVDVSGSMDHENKLPLAKKSLKLLTNNLRKADRISIVTYAGSTSVLLPSTSGMDKSIILMAIEQLGAGGSTAGESGLKLAYLQAQKGFIKGGNNRIVMMTDGDFNVGINSVESIKQLVKEKRKTGVYLSTVGFGTGNYRDDMMEQMADHGNGSYFYIDNYREAQRVFERNLRANLYAIAKDVKIQVEFNPSTVSEYRLVGYENRLLHKADFRNDKVDAGDIGQGHSVTAIYEITLVGNQGAINSKRYASETFRSNNHSNELAYVKLRYKPIGAQTSKLMVKTINA